MSLDVQRPSINIKGVEPIRIQKDSWEKIGQAMSALSMVGSIAGNVSQLTAPKGPYFNSNLDDYRGAGQAIGYRSPLYNSFSGVA